MIIFGHITVGIKHGWNGYQTLGYVASSNSYHESWLKDVLLTGK